MKIALTSVTVNSPVEAFTFSPRCWALSKDSTL